MTALAQRSFAAGEVAPSLYARVDNARYASALRTLRNFMVMRQGGVTNRPGTVFIEEVKDSSKVVRLIPFIFSADQTYILEFGDQYIRFYRNAAQINVSGVAAYAGGTPYVIGDLVLSVGIHYYCIQAGTGQTPASSPLYWYPLSGTVYEIPTPYADEDLAMLQFVQSADVITIVHPSYPPRELSRFDHTDWVLSALAFGTNQADVSSLINDGTPPGSITTSWTVTAVSITGEESIGITTSSADSPSSGAGIINLSWTAASGAVEYRIYREFDASGLIGTGLVGSVTGTTFADAGEVPEAGTPPVDPSLFQTANNYPSAVTYSQQRRIFANSNNNPETVWASRIGSFSNFASRVPTQDDDPVTFTLVGKQVNEIQHLLELRQLLALTTGSEWAINGNESGVITPSAINAKQQTFNGANSLSPLNVNGSALYTQARGSVVRDIAFTYEKDAYYGNDITIFSSHLFDQYTLVDWAFQQVPGSIVWAVRSDGSVLGLTYIPEQQMLAWHRHDFGGDVENVCVIPDGNEDAVYFVVKRTINSATVRYIEKLATRQITDIVDSIFMDSALSYDGRNTTATTMTISGGTDWDYQEDLTLTASASFFVVGDVGNAIHITGTDGTLIRLTITDYTSATVVTVRPHKTVPASMRSVAFTTWSKAVDQLSGLDHLEGEEVSVFADGFVVANPNNESYVVVTVLSGAITLDKPYSVIHVGLPVTADIETLDIDTAQSETLADKKKLITKINAYVEASRGIWAGTKPPTDDTVDPLEDLSELKIRDDENYDDPIALKTGVVEIPIKGEWNSNGRVFLRNIDPIPLSILAIIPVGYVPFRG